jgi:hypothetical protein
MTSRDTGEDVPATGADRPSGEYQGDESVPTLSDPDNPFKTEFTNEPPNDVKPAVPPYEGRQTSAKPDSGADGGDARTGGAVKPTADASPKGQTASGATASPADEQPASRMPETDRDDDAVGPAHTPGTGSAENKR